MSEADVWRERDYNRYAGPVARAYGHSPAPVSVIVGPTGGGKSTESARRILRVAHWQHASPRDGLRKCRVGVIAPTYRRLWDQVIPSYKKEINPAWGANMAGGGFKGAKGDPADHVFRVAGPDGVVCHVEVLFRAVGDMDLEEFFRGFEVTAWWLPEMDTHQSADILSFASNRVGRYPEPDDRPDLPDGAPAAYAGVWGDANAPEIDDWFYNRFWLKGGRKPGDAVFIQPSGFSPHHENAANLRKINPRYYQEMAAKLDAWAVRRLVENKPGYSRHGLPVHDLFDAQAMVTDDSIPADPMFPLVIGVDAGNTLAPAGVFLQRVWGQVRAVGESYTPTQWDLPELAREIRRLRETKFRHVPDAVIYVDPSARAASALNRQTNYARILQAETNIEVVLAPSNDPLARRGALDQLLKRRDGFAVSGPDCPGLVKALSGGYHFAKRGQKQSDTPNKVHPHSDIAEACQYGVLGMEGLGAAVRGGVIHPDEAGANLQGPKIILQD